MKNRLVHFAIHTDNTERARNFYDAVFDWGFNKYGPSDFLQINSDKTEDGQLIRALQARKYSPVSEKLIGLECTIGVENLDDTIERVKKHNGQLVMSKTAIPNVGWVAKFLDTEGNLICAMQFDNTAR
ncbi:VOC family protein [Fulvivirga lutea]|uniref:VOC domain-containing protein n=1 Tax=Fulvivirga lutea TaxID=2810512 RepID=A0A975A1W7_9BACT|nr:VOC family protein [Fulvivirga lutea]QSE98665.1 hypothetical protein JR347_06185 [Fulvivirga lutea]